MESVKVLVDGYCQLTGRPTFTITVDEYIKFCQLASTQTVVTPVGVSSISQSKENACKNPEHLKEYNLYTKIEKITPDVFKKVKNNDKVMCANVDMYSGLVYRMLGIPEDLFTPLFAVARMAGWSAHRMEEVLTGNRIIRPAYKAIAKEHEYIKIAERKND